MFTGLKSHTPMISHSLNGLSIQDFFIMSPPRQNTGTNDGTESTDKGENHPQSGSGIAESHGGRLDGGILVFLPHEW